MWRSGMSRHFLRRVNLLPPERNREAMDDEVIAAVASGDDTAPRKLFLCTRWPVATNRFTGQLRLLSVHALVGAGLSALL